MTHHFDTLAVHAGREDLASLGVHALPLDLSSTYPVHDLERASESLRQMGEGGPPAHDECIYARMHNPTVARFERGLAALEKTEESVAFSSGMAALTAVLLAAREHGENVVAVRPLYGGSDHLLATGMLGLPVRWTDAEHMRSVVDDRTALVIVESPGNPTLDLLDLESLVRCARGVPVLVDNTFATPVLQNPIDQGASLVLHSATKFLGGHGDVVGGVEAGDRRWTTKLRKIRVSTGALLHPLAGYLLHRGLATLALRVRAGQAGAQELARRLQEHPRVSSVRYPGLPGQDPAKVIGRQMRGPGALLAFEVRGGYDAATEVMRAVRLITSAVSLGSVDSLIQHPAGLTHQVVDPQARESTGITPGLLRLSVGVEDPEDLWEDLDHALNVAHERSLGLSHS
jgi:methionine-gamma-lyase